MLRRLLAAECGFAALVTAIGVFVFGATPLAFGLLAVCAFTMVPAYVLAGRSR